MSTKIKKSKLVQKKSFVMTRLDHASQEAENNIATTMIIVQGKDTHIGDEKKMQKG